MGSLATALTGIGSFSEGLSEATSILDDAFSTIGSYGGGNTDIPRAFVNYILFDQYFNYVDAGFDRISSSAGIPTGQETSVSFDAMNLNRIINDAGFTDGYMYIWVSNESQDGEVWFDDLTLDHRTHSYIVQTDDYYPFGLTFNGWQRAGEEPNRYLYNGKELQEDLDLGRYDYGARMYDAEIGRWHAIDPMSDVATYYTPYRYAVTAWRGPVHICGPEAVKCKACSTIHPPSPLRQVLWPTHKGEF